MNRIEFMAIVVAENCIPNGDVGLSLFPRVDYQGYGEISDVCIKRKIRDRLQEMGESIFVQSRQNIDDGCYSMKDRAEKFLGKKFTKLLTPDEVAKKGCEQWIDVRAFGQVFAYKGDSLSVPVRGAVSIQIAQSLEPVDVMMEESASSINREKNTGFDDNTIYQKHFIKKAVFPIKGGIYPQLAEKTGFTDDDAEKIKQALINLFQNDYSGFRPAGSMEMVRLYWWEHPTKNGIANPAKIFRSISIKPKEEWPYFEAVPTLIPGIVLKEYDFVEGFGEEKILKGE